MPTRITEVENREGVARALKVEGALTLEDAELLEGVCDELRGQSDAAIRVDLSAITFLDSESASVLCRLKRRGIALEGLDLFVRKVVELAEHSGDAR
ncbi:MAG TPA: STAS domain-containing protein [Pyrinomonadaceae bacterium]